MKEGATPKKPLGCDPNRSLLFAQVISGEPEMRIDEGNYLRNIGWQGKTTTDFSDVVTTTAKFLQFNLISCQGGSMVVW